MADPNPNPTPVPAPADPTPTPTPAPAVTEPKTFTQEEFDTQLEAAKKELEEKIRTQITADNDEAKKLSKMSAEEKLAYQQKQFEDEKAKHQRDKMEFEAGKILAEKSLPVGLAKYLCGADAESTQANITEFEKAFSGAVEAAVTDRLRGTPPKVGAYTPTISMESIKKMSVEEINQHWDEIKKVKN